MPSAGSSWRVAHLFALVLLSLTLLRVPHPLRRARFWFLRSEQRVGLRCTPSSQSLVSDLHLTSLAEPVIPITAPSPQLRRCHQSSFYRITMYVTQLLDIFPLRKNIEVIVTRLPESRWRHLIPELHLISILSLLPAATQRDALLQHLHCQR